MAEISEEDRAVIDRLNTALSSLIKNLNNDERLPWVHDLTRANIEISRVPPTFIDGPAFETAALSMSKLITREDDPTKFIRPDLIGSRLVCVEVTDETKLMLANFSFRDKEQGTIGFASVEFDHTGTISNVYHPTLYSDGELLGRKSGEYLQNLLTGLLLNSADDKEPASGTSCILIDGIKLYKHKEQIDTDAGFIDAPLRIAPRTMPRMRNDVAKEMKNYAARSPFPLTKQNSDYFTEIGTSLEQSNELWWVSEDMSKLAWDVTLSGTEPEDLSETEIPSPSGIMWLNGGGGPVLTVKCFPDREFLDTGDTPTELMSINAIIWYTPSVKIPGLQVGKTRFMALTAAPELVRDTSMWNGILSPMDLESNEMEFHRIPTYVTYHNLKYLARKMALVVMRLAREETLGEKTSEMVGGGSGNKKKHRNRRIDRVTCASLRRYHYTNDAEREAEARDYSHRWIVRGHMRNQPIGPRNAKGGQQHQRVWIAPYVKGPEDKPLVLKDRV
jgi:hypothetical protein